jgi:RNA polymerase sigma factor (sigma-70 family)
MRGKTSKKLIGEITDGELAERAMAGDESAYTSLIERYSSPLYNFICRFLNDSDLAYDILQQVFLQLYISLPKLRTGEPLRAWLFQVARNRCLDELRRKQAIHFSELQGSPTDEDLSQLDIIPDDSPLPEELAEQHDLQEILQRAISTLPPKFRAVVLLRYTAQLSFSEIGQALHMPEATAKTYFQRAKPVLRAALAEQLRPAALC